MSATTNNSRKRDVSTITDDSTEASSPPLKKQKIDTSQEGEIDSNDNKNKLSPSSLLEFAYLIGNLKSTKRTGWVRKGIDGAESIADHQYRMAILSWIFSEQFNKYRQDKSIEINVNKMIKMALCHDIIESICGDIVPIEKISGISKQEKYKIELNAMIKIRDEYLKNTKVGQEMYDLWIEFEQNKTMEAKIVKDLDKLDMIIQANEYEIDPKNKEKKIDLTEFFDGTRGVFQTDIGKALDQQLISQRNKRSNHNKSSK